MARSKRRSERRNHGRRRWAMTRRENWPTRLIATVTMPERDEPSVKAQDDDPADRLGDRHRDQAVVQEVEPLQCADRAAERVHGYGERHVERKEQEQELRLADQALGDARDDVREEDGKDHDARERDDPEHREAQEGGVERRGDQVVVFQLEVPADERHGGAGKAQLEDLEERDEGADERPDPVAQDAQLMGEDGGDEERDRHDGDGAQVTRGHIAAMADFPRLLVPGGVVPRSAVLRARSGWSSGSRNT